MSDTLDNLKTVLDAGVTIGRNERAGVIVSSEEGGIPFMVHPTGTTIVPVEHLLPAPVMKRAGVALHDADSFVEYVNRFKDAGSVVFAGLEQRRFDAVLDYHFAAPAGATPAAAVIPPSGARWGKHRASYICQPSPDWTRWTKGNGEPMDQLTFARFIEDGIPNIAAPSGALLLEIALTLEAKSDVAFRSHHRLQNGQHQFRYEETIAGRAGAELGAIEIPDVFTLLLEPFLGAAPQTLTARFRYRINQGALKLWFELVRPDDVLRDAFDVIVHRIDDALGDVPLLLGAAPDLK